MHMHAKNVIQYPQVGVSAEPRARKSIFHERDKGANHKHHTVPLSVSEDVKRVGKQAIAQ